ncbi:Acyl-CoA 6-desaturase [Flagellimonas maritima]|uniref:Acyl-CoA 6-desaturase n=1 Tax=Flagellimonas maritima TaxID=1383885 RepID=A0A2Z4LPL5_9FLAO|nr:fatty acid desaturase [Allomuricauda aurantiaca]AWX43732.1 Acyl-CoA 6-desaturase [Allomuricauda aurantiaca]
MITKNVAILTLFFGQLVMFNISLLISPWLLFILYITSGIGMPGIGIFMMHNAIHGSYCKSKKVNKYLGYTMNLIGANATAWKIQHNYLHHFYTNIKEADDDISLSFSLGFLQMQRKIQLITIPNNPILRT